MLETEIKVVRGLEVLKRASSAKNRDSLLRTGLDRVWKLNVKGLRVKTVLSAIKKVTLPGNALKRMKI